MTTRWVRFLCHGALIAFALAFWIALGACRDTPAAPSDPDAAGAPEEPARVPTGPLPASPDPASAPPAAAPAHFFIAIIDSGIEAEHPWFAHAFVPLEAVRPALPPDLVPAQGDQFIGWDVPGDQAPPVDRVGHGTHVAGILASELGMDDPETPFRFVVLRTGDRNHDLEDVTAALGHLSALKSAGLAIPVVLLPVEYYPVDGDAEKLANFEAALANLLDGKTLVVAAAGNRDLDIDQPGDANRCYPSSFPFPDLLSVACCNDSGFLSPLSNTGAVSVDLAAPGFGVESAWLGGETSKHTGTSQSAALAAARAAKLWIADRSQSAAAVRAALLKTARLHASLLQRVASNGYLPREAPGP